MGETASERMRNPCPGGGGEDLRSVAAICTAAIRPRRRRHGLRREGGTAQRKRRRSRARQPGHVGPRPRARRAAARRWRAPEHLRNRRLALAARFEVEDDEAARLLGLGAAQEGPATAAEAASGTSPSRIRARPPGSRRPGGAARRCSANHSLRRASERLTFACAAATGSARPRRPRRRPARTRGASRPPPAPQPKPQRPRSAPRLRGRQLPLAERHAAVRRLGRRQRHPQPTDLVERVVDHARGAFWRALMSIGRATSPSMLSTSASAWSQLRGRACSPPAG